MKRPIFVISVIFTIIIGLAIVQTSVANQISTTGVELVALQKEVTTYKRENVILNEQLLEAASFTTLSEKAKKLGFVEAKTPIYLHTPLPLALR